MNKKLSIAHSFLLLPLLASSYLVSMELALSHGKADDKRNQLEEKKHPLAESTINLPMPTTRGLGVISFFKDCAWNEEDNTFARLSNKEQPLDLKNSSNPRKIDTAIENYSHIRPDSSQLAKTIALCREEPYKGQILIAPIPFRLAHKFLVQENKAKQAIFKKTIETNDERFIRKFNVLLDDLQDIITTKIERMNTILNEHVEERDTLVKEKGDDIRILKQALVNLHHLNKQKNVLPINDKDSDDGYCSDKETDPDNAEKPYNVEKSYDDPYLLQKINVNCSMAQTKTNTEKMLSILYDINQKLVDLDPIAYKPTI